MLDYLSGKNIIQLKWPRDTFGTDEDNGDKSCDTNGILA